MKRKVLPVLGLKSILLSGLLLGVVSCRTNDTDNAVNSIGKPLAVRMNLLGADFEDDSGAQASRSSVVGDVEQKIVSISPSKFMRVRSALPEPLVNGTTALKRVKSDYNNATALGGVMYYTGTTNQKSTLADRLNINFRHNTAHAKVVVSNTMNGMSGSFPVSSGVMRRATSIFTNSGAFSDLSGSTPHVAVYTDDIAIGGVMKTINLPSLFQISPGFSQTFNVSLTRCGAYLGPNQTNWKDFMCHNLGADESLDPFTPDAGLHGAKYQWGYKPSDVNVSDSRYYTQADDQSKSGAIEGWLLATKLSNVWSDTKKAANDPCPSGYRVPTAAQWQAVIDNNPIQFVGSRYPDDYSLGLTIGDSSNPTLFLPAAGDRVINSGELEFRGVMGFYWSSSLGSVPTTISIFNFSKFKTRVFYAFRTFGYSVRCIAE